MAEKIISAQTKEVDQIRQWCETCTAPEAPLDHTMRRAAERGIANLIPAQGDAQRLPLPGREL